MVETMTLKEVSVVLDYKKIVSVEKWLKAHSVNIYEDEIGRRYVIQMQFEHARLKKFIEWLKGKFKDKWLEAFKAYSSQNMINVIEIEEGEESRKPVNTLGYKPLGKEEKKFLVKLQNIKPEI
jgi:hypothetical protein